jgi:hypothetical protein
MSVRRKIDGRRLAVLRDERFLKVVPADDQPGSALVGVDVHGDASGGFGKQRVKDGGQGDPCGALFSEKAGSGVRSALG